MGFVSSFAHSARTLTRREFWTFKVAHALVGGLITVVGASGGIFLTDHIRKDILIVDGQIADNARRTESIERALTQFQLVQTEGFLLGALSSGEAIRSDMRKNFQDLGFLIRRGAVSRLIIELNQDNPAGLMADRKEQERLFDAAVAAKDLSAWDQALRFEMENETKLRGLEAQVQAKRADLTAQRRGLESWLATATNLTFIIQQLGFFVVLLAGLIHQHDHPQVKPADPARSSDPALL